MWSEMTVLRKKKLSDFPLIPSADKTRHFLVVIGKQYKDIFTLTLSKWIQLLPCLRKLCLTVAPICENTSDANTPKTPTKSSKKTKPTTTKTSSIFLLKMLANMDCHCLLLAVPSTTWTNYDEPIPTNSNH